MKKLKDLFLNCNSSSYLWGASFLLLFTAMVLSLLNVGVGTSLSGQPLVFMGYNLYFEKDFNAIALVAFLILFFSLFVSLASLFNKKIKPFVIVMALTALVMYIMMPMIINHPNPTDPELSLFKDVNYSAGLAVIIALLVSTVLILFSDFAREINWKQPVKFTVGEITELAMLIALAVGLNFGPKIPLQWAGSINFQIVPLIMIALRFSTGKSFMAAGIIFGLITVFTDGYGLFAYPMEYLIAFGSVAIISPFRHIILKNETDKKKRAKRAGIAISLLVLLISIQTVIRLCAASIDSVVFYAAYLEGADLWAAAFLYNAPYVCLTGVVTIATIIALYYPLVMINKLFKHN